MKKDKKKSVEVFGPFIHTYKFDEAVSDGVVLDLRYEARDIDQRVKSQAKVDEWFEVKTKALSRLGRQQLKEVGLDAEAALEPLTTRADRGRYPARF